MFELGAPTVPELAPEIAYDVAAAVAVKVHGDGVNVRLEELVAVIWIVPALAAV